MVGWFYPTIVVVACFCGTVVPPDLRQWYYHHIPLLMDHRWFLHVKERTTLPEDLRGDSVFPRRLDEDVSYHEAYWWIAVDATNTTNASDVLNATHLMEDLPDGILRPTMVFNTPWTMLDHIPFLGSPSMCTCPS